ADIRPDTERDPLFSGRRVAPVFPSPCSAPLEWSSSNCSRIRSRSPGVDELTKTGLAAPHVAGNKARTGIAGFDEVTGGGLPRGRTTLLVGGPGSGKTIFALQFLVHGA